MDSSVDSGIAFDPMHALASPIEPNAVVAGKFKVERIIGSGGVGLVVAAKHLQLGETVALKFLLPSAARDKNDLARFFREAQAAVRLKNEHVARIIDVGKADDGSPFMVMEYLEGQDLGKLLRSHGALSVYEAVDYLLQVCEAVAEAHSLGIIHRDLKPSNFFMSRRRDGSVLIKVLDFGIAKAKLELEPEDVRLTETRSLLGSPVYMSPEQVRSARSVDQRSDIWSLGVSLYELLTDSVPFGGDSVTAVAAAVTSDPVPPILERRQDLPAGLVRVIEQCLQKPADLRYPSVADLAEALLPFGPEDARLQLQRIRGTLGLGRTLRAVDPGPTDDRDVPSPAPASTTLISYDTTHSRPTRPSGRRLAVVGLGSAVAIVIVALVLLSLQHRPAPTAAEPSANPSGLAPVVATSATPAAVAPSSAPPASAAATSQNPAPAAPATAKKAPRVSASPAAAKKVPLPPASTAPPPTTKDSPKKDATRTVWGGVLDETVETRN